MPCPDIRPLSEVPELNGIGYGNGILPNSEVPAVDGERWIQGNGGVIRFYSQGPIEAGQYSPEGEVTESLVEDWWLRREYRGPQMSYGLDLVCNRMNFRGIPISHCEFDLVGSDIGRRLSGDGAYVDQHIDQHNENRIVRIQVSSLNLREESSLYSAYGSLDFQRGGEVGHTARVDYGVDLGIAGGDYSVNVPIVNEKAEELLLNFLDSKQRKSYKKDRFFEHIEKAANREWRFHFRIHYPVEFRSSDSHYECNPFIGLCIELENETPKEDLLLMSLLEVRGGRGDEIIKAGRRNPQPLREDQRLHPGDSPEEGVIEFSGSEADLRRLRQRWQETIERGRTTMQQLEQAFNAATMPAEDFANQMREIQIRSCGISPEQIGEEDRRTAIEIQNPPPLTFERLRDFIQGIENMAHVTPRITRISCNSEAYDELLRVDGIVLGSEVSVSLWGIQVCLDPNQREPFKIIQ